MEIGTDGGSIELLDHPLKKFLPVVLNKLVTEGLVRAWKKRAHFLKLRKNILLG